MTRLVLLAFLLVLGGCAAKVAPPAPRLPAGPQHFWIPEWLKDSDTLCVPHNGGGLCRAVGEIRAIVASAKAAP